MAEARMVYERQQLLLLTTVVVGVLCIGGIVITLSHKAPSTRTSWRTSIGHWSGRDTSTDLLERCQSGTLDYEYASEVHPSDTELVRPPQPQHFGSGKLRRNNLPIVAPITAYHWTGADKFPPSQYEVPIYETLDRDSADFWNYCVDELLLSRVPVVMLHGRGCYSAEGNSTDGPGKLCPRLLSNFVSAVRRAGAESVVKVGMFDDTASKPELARVDRLDLSLGRKSWKYLWDHNIRIWFDTIPRSWWYLFQGKPIIASWTLSNAFFSNQQGHASEMLSWLKGKFYQRYGIEPHFILQETWFKEDTTITEDHALGKHGWFQPKSDRIDSVHSFRSYNGMVWGVATPGFRNGKTLAGCGVQCREVTRRNGQTLINAFEKAVEANTTFMLLEGWTDMAESAGFYRSDDWTYPTQYINIVRRYADPEPETLRFQAEGADAFNHTTVANKGRQYANRTVDVGKLPGTDEGWYVGFAKEGEWLEYQNVILGCGRYRLTARVATRSAGKKLRMVVNDFSLPTVEVPSTGGIEKYGLVHLGQIKLEGGSYNLRLVFESTGGLNVDWFFVKRSADCYCHLDEPAVASL